ncbi:NnrS family protein [Marinobacter salinus]
MIVVRTSRWKLWHCRNRPDLLVLALGYLWLAAGSDTARIAGNDWLPLLR